MQFIVYKDARREWRWKLRAQNGNIMADSGEGYLQRKNCLKAIASIKKRALGAKVEIRS